MCLIFVSFNTTAGYPLVVAANRDEFYDRAAAAADYWDDHPEVLAGRDLVARGTWLGVSRSKRFAALTNYRSGLPRDPNAPSRGNLVKDFLLGAMSPYEYFEALCPKAPDFAEFSLLAYADDQLAYFSNREGPPRILPAGIYGLSNDLLDTPWPKVVDGKAAFATLLRRSEWGHSDLLNLMADKGLPPDVDLPETRVGPGREQMLAPMMVTGDAYGTRCSTALSFEATGSLQFVERSYQPLASEISEVVHELN